MGSSLSRDPRKRNAASERWRHRSVGFFLINLVHISLLWSLRLIYLVLEVGAYRFAGIGLNRSRYAPHPARPCPCRLTRLFDPLFRQRHAPPSSTCIVPYICNWPRKQGSTRLAAAAATPAVEPTASWIWDRIPPYLGLSRPDTLFSPLNSKQRL